MLIILQVYSASDDAIKEEQVIRRLIIVALLGISMVAMLGTEAQSFSIGGWAISIGSITCKVFGPGADESDEDKKVRCQLEVQSAQFSCQNKGGNDGGQGKPFQGKPFDFSDVTITGTDFLDPEQIEGDGTWSSKIKFTDKQIQNALADYFHSGYCQNRNWTPIPGTIRVTELLATLTTSLCIDGFCEQTDKVKLSCELGKKDYNYKCSELYPDEKTY
jgi:hypothetical protein